MARRWLAGGLAVAALAWAGAAGGERMRPIPEAGRIFNFEIGAATAWGMSAEQGESGLHVGLSLVCRTEDPAYAEATAYFGRFPADRRPVQLAVQSPEGSVERFGGEASWRPEAVVHSPRVTDLRDLERFVKAVLRRGALVSNGHRTFRNRASEARNAEVREAMLGCLQAVVAAGR